MKRFDEILGQATPIELLRSMLERDRVPQSLMLQGPAGVGKATVAEIFAAGLLCPHGTSGCGECDSCHLIAAGNHPDLYIVRRLPKERPTRKTRTGEPELAKVISVDQIREMTRIAGQSPRQGSRRVVLIDEAETMNANAQNALLKTLEEPAPKTVMLLVTANPRALLPTVRSRCLSIRFAALRTEDLAGLLEEQGYPPEEALLRAALADGRPGAAIAADLEEDAAQREEFLSALERLTGRPPAIEEIPGYAAVVAGRDDAELTAGLDLLQGLLRDAARAATSADSSALLHQDLADRLAKLGRSLGVERAARLVEAVDRTRQGQRFNLNRSLLAETLLAAVAGGPLP